MGNFKEDIARVRAFVFDVDGVFTDGGIIVTPEGDFVRKYNAKDGFALSHAIKKGYLTAVITGGRGNCLEARFRMLGIDKLYPGCLDKLNKLKEFMAEHDLKPDEVLFMGDDIPDVEPMTYVGMPVCPADAATEVVRVSRYVSPFKGGEGCIRDVVEQTLRARGDWFSPNDPHADVASA